MEVSAKSGSQTGPKNPVERLKKHFLQSPGWTPGNLQRYPGVAQQFCVAKYTNALK
jgi:hypothetical protein